MTYEIFSVLGSLLTFLVLCGISWWGLPIRRRAKAISRTEALERWNEQWNDEFASSGDPVAACKAADAGGGMVQLDRAITDAWTQEVSRNAQKVMILPEGATIQPLTSPEIGEMADTVAEATKTIADLQKQLEAKSEQLRRIDREGIRFAIATDHVELATMGSRDRIPIATAHVEVLVTRDEIEALAREKAYHQTHAMPLMAIPAHEHTDPNCVPSWGCSCRACEAMRDFGWRQRLRY